MKRRQPRQSRLPSRSHSALSKGFLILIFLLLPTLLVYNHYIMATTPSHPNPASPGTTNQDVKNLRGGNPHDATALSFKDSAVLDSGKAANKAGGESERTVKGGGVEDGGRSRIGGGVVDGEFMQSPKSASNPSKTLNPVLPSLLPLPLPHATTPPLPPLTSNVEKSVFIFTMDSITTYSDNASKGGPKGEILVRECLQEVIKELYPSVTITVATSDASMQTLGNNKPYDVYIFDPWTWADPGWKLRSFVPDGGKVVILDFFGTEDSYVVKNGGIRGFEERYLLKAYPVGGRGTFLGFYLEEGSSSMEGVGEKGGERKVVVWGKDPAYFTPSVISMIASISSLPSVTVVTPLPLSAPVKLPAEVVRTGHLKTEEYHDLLGTATHLLGLGHPLLGPSGVEGVSYGCVLINPVYKKGREVKGMTSQQDYIRDYVPDSNCDYELGAGGLDGVKKCLEKTSPLTGVPKEFKRENYKMRVKDIFDELFMGG